jgi:hypothetical protein
LVYHHQLAITERGRRETDTEGKTERRISKMKKKRIIWKEKECKKGEEKGEMKERK